MFQHRQRFSSGTHDINITPLIDVSLTLVVILLLAAPLAFESSIAVRAGAAQGRVAPSETDMATIEVTILSNDEVRVNRDVVAFGDLASVLSPMLADPAHGRVLVDAREGVTHGRFVTVLDEARQCGATDIAVTGR